MVARGATTFGLASRAITGDCYFLQTEFSPKFSPIVKFIIIVCMGYGVSLSIIVRSVSGLT